ncbi:MAG TPA: hypothetical protein VGV92_03820 [Gammaproteobacteria bacterium]|nr:hypothetical protein [Gammaproteobacteria bacterium]
MAKTNEEDAPDADLAEEVVAEVVEADDAEEIPEEDSKEAPVKKKVAALKARHRLEDYFEMKRIQDELDYLDDEKKRKAELLLKVTQQEKLEHPEPVKSHPKIKEVKAVKEVKKEAKVEPKVELKPIKAAKPKTKPKAKVQAKAKPKAKPKKKAKK